MQASHFWGTNPLEGAGFVRIRPGRSRHLGFPSWGAGLWVVAPFAQAALELEPMKSIEDVANELANAHREEDPKTVAVYLADSSSEVRLVEVSSSVGDSGEVLPFRFAASREHGVPYPSVVVLLSEADWKRVEAGDLDLPADWGAPKDLRKIA